PQWPRPVEASGQYAAEELLELVQSAWARQGRLPPGGGGGEIFFCAPHRCSEPVRDPAYPLPIARDEGEALADQRDEPFVFEAIRTWIENVYGTHVAWCVCCVQGQQRHLERRQPLRHGSPPVLVESLAQLRYYR